MSYRLSMAVLALCVLTVPMARAEEAPPLPTVITPSVDRNSAHARAEAGGRFFFEATVNGGPVQMMFDTGASVICLREEDAPRLGIDVSALHYSGHATTANGTAEIARVMIKTITVGRITLNNVPGLVAKPGTLSDNLLGQSFLSRLAGYRIEGTQLTLQGQ